MKGMVWSSIEKICVQGVSFIVGIILARLLTPSDYGLIGMLSIFLAISQKFIDGGLPSALIQKKDCTDVDYSTVFVTNIAMAVLFYTILFFCAPLIANFYNEPILKDLTRVIALNFILGSFNTIQRTKLYKAVDFKSLAKINVSSSLISGVTGITLAYSGFGVWALVAQGIVSTIVNVILLPFFSKWNFSLRFSKKSLKRLFGYGSKLMISAFYSIIINNISTMFIGKTYNSAQLGYYTRGQGYPSLIANTVYSVLGSVSFPILSNLQDDKERFLRLYKKGLFMIALVVFPPLILLALLAKPLVIILLTEKWLPCVIFIQIMCIARLFYPLSALNLNVLNAVGRSDLSMKIDFSKAPLLLITLAITIPISVEAIVWGQLFNSFICFFINAYLPGKMFGYGAFQQIKDWKYIILSLLIMSASLLIFIHIVDNSWIQLIVGGLGGIAIYLSCCLTFGIIEKRQLVNYFHKITQRFHFK